jgi:hypothetical protein
MILLSLEIDLRARLLFLKFIRQRFPDLQIVLETIVSCGAS